MHCSPSDKRALPILTVAFVYSFQFYLTLLFLKYRYWCKAYFGQAFFWDLYWPFFWEVSSKSLLILKLVLHWVPKLPLSRSVGFGRSCLDNVFLFSSRSVGHKGLVLACWTWTNCYSVFQKLVFVLARRHQPQVFEIFRVFEGKTFVVYERSWCLLWFVCINGHGFRFW